MEGVTAAWGNLLVDMTIATGAELIAEWDNGFPFVATKGSSVAGVNIFIAVSGYWTGDIPLILHNTAFWSSAGVSWLSCDPTGDTIPAGDSVNIEVTFDATVLNGGDYFADIIISSNDPDEPEVIVPAHLNVTGAPDIAVSEDTLDYGIVFIGASVTDTLIVSNEGTDSLTVSDISSNNSDYTVDTTSFALNPEESQEVLVTFTPITTGASTGILTITSDDPDEPTVTVSLLGECTEPPDISVTPDSLSDSLFTGETSMQLLTIYNEGVSDLIFNISIEGVEADLLSVEDRSKSFKEISAKRSVGKKIRGKRFDSGYYPVRLSLPENRIPPEVLSTQGISVLIIYEDCSDVSEIQGLLSGFPDIVVVDTCNGNVVPTLDDLLAYDEGTPSTRTDITLRRGVDEVTPEMLGELTERYEVAMARQKQLLSPPASVDEDALQE